jgi:hypothetical protein
MGPDATSNVRQRLGINFMKLLISAEKFLDKDKSLYLWMKYLSKNCKPKFV